MFEILTQFFDIPSKIKPYNVRDIDPNFVLIMLEILTHIFEISTKIREILNMFKNLPKIYNFYQNFRYFD